MKTDRCSVTGRPVEERIEILIDEFGKRTGHGVTRRLWLCGTTGCNQADEKKAQQSHGHQFYPCPSNFPLLDRRGGCAIEKKAAFLAGADGVVDQASTYLPPRPSCPGGEIAFATA